MYPTIDRQSRVPVFRQISQYFSGQILQGALPEGFRLPPERTLARSLGVNRSTVMNAYAELKAEGLVHGRVGDGTRVTTGGPEAPARPDAVQPLRWSDFSRLSFRPTDEEIKNLLALSERQDVILLSLGFPSMEAVPTRMLREATEDVLRKRGAASLFYAPAEGVSRFRAALATLMGERGAPLSSDEIVVTSGSQQALDIIVRTLIEPGDTVVVEEPTYLGALQIFRAAGCRLVTVPVDHDGMRVDLLPHLLERYNPKLIYTLPTYQNPSGTVLSQARRVQLLDLAYRFRIPIVEDDVYGDLWYDSPPPPALCALDRHGFVLYAGSFSKALCPGLRVGWIAGPRLLVRRLVQVKQLVDLQAPTLSQMIVERVLETGQYARHVQQARKRYTAHRAAMEDALRRHARGWAEWRQPAGGFYYWIRLAPPLAEAGLAVAAAEKAVSVLPGAACIAGESSENHIRLSFSCATPQEIATGIARLSRVARRLGTQTRETERSVDATRPVI